MSSSLPTAVRWLRRQVVRVVVVAVGLPLIGLAHLLRPLVRIRIGILRHDRLGHLVANIDFWLRQRSVTENRGREFNLILAGVPANRQVLTMIKRRVTVWENGFLALLISMVARRYPRSPIWIDLRDSGLRAWEVWNTVPTRLSFTEDEHRRGQAALRSLGIPEGASFACFTARDKAYLDTARRERPREAWSYHDYRDCDIDNYMPAAEFLAAQGVWALRVGAIVERPITSRQSRVIDYATHFRSDFLDVYLMTHCRFYLGCTAGSFIVPSAFGVPSALANMTPLGYAARGARDLFIPKKYRDAESKRVLSFREVIALGADRWHQSQKFRDAGIEVIENASDEILALAMEMAMRLDNAWVPAAEDEELQKRFRALFPPSHPTITGYPSRVGAEFLRQNARLLE